MTYHYERGLSQRETCCQSSPPLPGACHNGGRGHMKTLHRQPMFPKWPNTSPALVTLLAIRLLPNEKCALSCQALLLFLRR